MTKTIPDRQLSISDFGDGWKSVLTDLIDAKKINKYEIIGPFDWMYESIEYYLQKNPDVEEKYRDEFVRQLLKSPRPRSEIDIFFKQDKTLLITTVENGKHVYWLFCY